MNQILTGINDFMYTYIYSADSACGCWCIFYRIYKGSSGSFIERWIKIHYGKENRK